MNNRTSSIFKLVLTTIFWAGNFHLAPIAVKYISPLGASAHRYFWGVAVLVLMGVFLKKSFRVARIHWLPLVTTSIIGIFIFNYFFFKGLETTSPVNGAIIIALNPLFTILVSRIFLPTKIEKKYWLGLILGFAGVVILVTKGNLNLLGQNGIVIGDIFILIACLCFAFYNVMTKRYLGEISPLILTVYVSAISFVLFVLFSVPELSTSIWEPSWELIISTLLMGVLGTSIAFVFWNEGISDLGAHQSAIFINLVSGIYSFD